MAASERSPKLIRRLGLSSLVFGFGWLLALIATWSELSVLLEGGFSHAALSVLGHQLGFWTLVAACVVVAWWILFTVFSRGRSPRTLTSAWALTIAVTPLFLFLAHRYSLVQGVYLGDLLSGRSIGFVFQLGIRLLLIWLLMNLGVEMVRRLGSRGGHRLLSIAAIGLAALMLAVMIGGSAASVAGPDRPPDVLLIVVDALRPDHLGTFDYERPTSPNIDAFAAQGIRFDSAISQSTLTKTSIASLFTGLAPHHHGVYSGHRLTSGRIYSDVLPESLPTLASELRDAGYLTAAWLQQSQLKAASGYDRGFHFYHEDSRDIATINQRFLRWRRRIGQSAPVFAYLHYIDLHDPYRPKPPYDTLYGPTASVREKLDESRWKNTLSRVQSGEIVLDRGDVEELINLYDGQVTYMDRRLGELFEDLELRGLMQSSLIVLTSDHGDGFMEHGFISHSVKPYDELIRVPLIMRLPGGQQAGTRVEQQVRLIDVMPSILEKLALPVPEGIDGMAVWDLMDGSTAEPLAVSEVEMEMGDGYEYFASIRSRQWKLIGSSVEPFELYDLIDDPDETENLFESSGAAAEPLLERFQEITKARESLQVDQVPVDAQTEEKLRSLGYIE